MRTFPSANPASRPSKKLRFATGSLVEIFASRPRKPLEIRRLFQRPVHPGELTSSVYQLGQYQFLDIEDHAQLLADELAIGVADLRVRSLAASSPPKVPPHR